MCIMILAAMMAAKPALAAPGVERWIATSHTAMAITGDITLSPTRLTMAGRTLPLAVVTDDPAFRTNDGPVAARILRVTRTSDPVLLHGNHLGRATWIAVWREHRFGQQNLAMAVFSGRARPTGEDDPSLTGTYLYARP